MPVGAKVAIVADDLTGAIETACVFVNQGLAARVTMAGPGPHKSARVPVVAINTRTRGCLGPKAWDQLAFAVAHPAAAGSALIYKKIDSTLRGDPASEIACLTSLLRKQLVIITPALPSQGRAFVDGRLYVNGVPLERTQYAADLQAPAQENVLAQLSRALPEAKLSGGATPPAVSAGCTTIWVADAETVEDLDRIAQWGLSRPESVLFAGAAGLAQALARHHRSAMGLAPTPRPSPPQLFVLGSRSDETKRQLRALAAQGDVAVITCSNSEAVPALRAPRRAATTVMVPAEHPQDPQRVAEHLAATAWAFMKAHRIRRVFASGGDTAMALLDVPGIKSLILKGEVAPGMCLSRFRHQHDDYELVTKPGGYGDEQTLARLMSPTSWPSAFANVPLPILT